MTKKSASQFKIADGKRELPPIEDVFENQKKGMVATIEVQIKQDSRFDTMMAVRETFLRFYRDENEMTLGYAKKLCAKIKKAHESIMAKVKGLTLEQATSEDWTNPCDKLVDFDDPHEWSEVFEQSIIFSAVQPYGQAFDDLHGRMMEEVAKRA